MLPSSRVSSLNPSNPAFYAVAAVFLWGTSDFAGGFASRRANAFVLTAFSHLCALVLMLVVALSLHDQIPSRESMLWAYAAGAIGGFALALFMARSPPERWV